MKNLDYSNIKIDGILEEINKTYFLPDIQREFVWLNNKRVKKIENFFDSILKGLPIGSIMIWQIEKEQIQNNFTLYKFLTEYKEKQLSQEVFEPTKDTRTDLNLIIDGQQRLTALYLVLKGRFFFSKHNRKYNNTPSELYINLNKIPNSDNENYELSFLTQNEYDDSLKNNEKKWYKLKDIYNYKFVQELSGDYLHTAINLNKAIGTAIIGRCTFKTESMDEHWIFF